MDNSLNNILVLLIGSPEFARRLKPMFSRDMQVISGTISEAWSLLVTNKPDCLILEVGLNHNEISQANARKLLRQVRERFAQQIYITIALMAPEKFFYGGDLLFTEDSSAKHSGLVDTFVASPPSNLPNVPSLQQQFSNLLELLAVEFKSRRSGKAALPTLGSPGWAQSLADPVSRTLWMRWLPRYASYTNENPIIIGETGTGKTNLAYALHLLSGRPGQFVSITPRDFSSSELVQAELFGAVAGAYTGAVDKWGLVKKAEKGTLFIDELQSIDKELQGKLITFIENKVYRRVGSSETVEADVRFVFASNRSLYDMMATNILRDDFAYRLERVQLDLLSLNQRPLDIATGLAHALAKVFRQRPHGLPVEGLSSDAYRLLFTHRWPGNLRQLENSAAKLCEIASMKNLRTIDNSVVAEVFQSRLIGSAFSAPEVIAEAAVTLASKAISEQVNTLNQGLNILIESIRTLALKTKGGDIAAAAKLIQDDTKLLDLFVQGHLIKQIDGDKT